MLTSVQFYEPCNLVEALQSFQRGSHGALPSLPSRFVKSLKVRTRHLGHKKPVKRISSQSAAKTFFDCEELGGKVSVETYFKKSAPSPSRASQPQHSPTRTEYPNLPLRHAATMPVVDIGPRHRAVWVPAELCEIISGTPYVGKLDGRETAQMIKYACNDPATNANSIVREGLPRLGLNPSAAPSPLAAFGIRVASEMTVIPARVLPQPSLSYKVGRPTIKDGSWSCFRRYMRQR